MSMLPIDHTANPLLELLREPRKAGSLGAADWELVLRTARPQRLLAALAARLDESAGLAALPAAPRAHLLGAQRATAYRQALLAQEVDALGAALAGHAGAVVLLKGAAYVEQSLPGARARLISDLDVLVPKGDLDAVEARLAAAGYLSQKADAYDQRYYREWSHELPPMRREESMLEVDLHHDVLPPTGRLHPDARALVAAARPAGHRGFLVPCPEDQVLHACAHLVQDSDFLMALRDLVDIDGLLAHFSTAPGFAARLVERARLHQLERPLWYALRYREHLLGSVPIAALADWQRRHAPAPLATALMDRCVPRALLAPAPDRIPGPQDRAARLGLRIRYYWLRMPPLLLARHAATKGLRSLRKERPAEAL